MVSPRIFIAEDDEGVLELLRVRLELAGYAVSYARNGQSAMENIFAANPDGIILDIGLPIRDGFNVLRSLRSTGQFRTTPVLMLTARHDMADVQRAIAAGAQDYLTKPFDDQKLLARVARMIRSHKKTAGPATQSPNWLAG
jgi:DNA-binding response OmpR family regulator